MTGCSIYENSAIHQLLGNTLRPGGFHLTEQAVAICQPEPNWKGLDLGCGIGATVRYLEEQYDLHVTGIDPSLKQIQKAQTQYPKGEFVLGKAEELPFAEESFEVVFAECTLSLMENLPQTIREAYRVLKKGGWFFVTDVYARNPDAVPAANLITIGTCMNGMHDLTALQNLITSTGFLIVDTEDCSEHLKQLMVQIIFEYGSLDLFWEKTVGRSTTTDGLSYQKIIQSCRPGYFFLASRKGE